MSLTGGNWHPHILHFFLRFASFAGKAALSGDAAGSKTAGGAFWGLFSPFLREKYGISHTFSFHSYKQRGRDKALRIEGKQT